MLCQSYEKNKLTQKRGLLEHEYFTRSMPLLDPNHCFMTCGGTEALISTTIFRKHGTKTSSGDKNTTS